MHKIHKSFLIRKLKKQAQMVHIIQQIQRANKSQQKSQKKRKEKQKQSITQPQSVQLLKKQFQNSNTKQSKILPVSVVKQFNKLTKEKESSLEESYKYRSRQEKPIEKSYFSKIHHQQPKGSILVIRNESETKPQYQHIKMRQLINEININSSQGQQTTRLKNSISDSPSFIKQGETIRTTMKFSQEGIHESNIKKIDQLLNKKIDIVDLSKSPIEKLSKQLRTVENRHKRYNSHGITNKTIRIQRNK